MRASNVLILMSDEHTRSVFGAYGNSLAQTPTLDALACDGVRFSDAYTPSPICIPARASFATGLPVFEHRCWSSAEPYYGQSPSWMHRLRARGHRVVSIGKLHYRSARDDTGFSESVLPMYLANDGRGWPQGLQRKPMADFPESVEMAALLGPGETSYTRYDRDIAAAAVGWLEREAPREAQPWALFVSFVSPHFPLSAPEQFYAPFREVELPAPYDRDPPVHASHPVEAQMREFWDYTEHFSTESEIVGLRNYYGLCSFLDDNLRQVLAALERSGQRDDTLVIYTSDHGDLIGNHGIWGKSFMYEDSVGIPLLVAGPGIEAGVNPTPVTLADLAATIELAIGAEPLPAAQEWRGRPLQEFIERPEPDRPVIAEYHDGGSPCGVFMLREGHWKLLYYADGHPPQLFDIEDDPRELRDRAGDPACAPVRGRLEARLGEILDPEAVNREAFADQAKMIDALGGIDAIRASPSFNHTPLDEP